MTDRSDKVAVSCLIRGMSPLRIHPAALERILPLLEEEKKHAVDLGNVEVVKRIQTITREIKSILSIEKKRKPKKQKNLRKKKTSMKSSKKQSKECQTDIVESIEHILEQKPEDQTARIVPLLKRKKALAIKNGDYVGAQAIDEVAKEYRDKSRDSLCWEVCATKYCNMREQLRHAEKDLERAQRKWAKKWEKFQKEMEESDEMTEELHQQQIYDLIELWPKELPPNRRKLSKATLEMKAMEKKMVRAGRYIEADKIRATASLMEEAEIEEQKKKYALEFDKYMLQLKRAQEKEVSCQKMKWEGRINSMKVAEEKEIGALTLTVSNMKKKIDPTPGITHNKPFFVAPPDSSEERGRSLRASKIIYGNLSFKGK